MMQHYLVRGNERFETALMSQDEKYMLQAIAEAERAFARGDVPVGAVVVKNGEVLGRGSNVKTADPTAHAEILAIRMAAESLNSWNLSECDLYVTMEPCAMCAGACVTARVRNIVFGAKDYRAGAAGSLYVIPRDARLNHRCGVRGGVMETACTELLVKYFRIKRSNIKRNNHCSSRTAIKGASAGGCE